LKLVLDADVYVLGLQPSAGHALVPRTEVPTTSGLRKPKTQTLPSPRVGANNRLNHNGGTSTPNPPVRAGHKSSSGEDALTEMINMTIVDRSPAVKWDDVGKNCYN
jgi:spastin